jgi:hypothetical protein
MPSGGQTAQFDMVLYMWPRTLQVREILTEQDHLQSVSGNYCLVGDIARLRR